MLQPIEKRCRVQNVAYLRWVKSKPCVCCGNPESVYHHLIGLGDGATASKADDYFSIPLCVKHHTGDEGVHQGYKMWERRWGKQAEHCVRLLLLALTEGVISAEISAEYLFRLERHVGMRFINEQMAVYLDQCDG